MLCILSAAFEVNWITINQPKIRMLGNVTCIAADSNIAKPKTLCGSVFILCLSILALMITYFMRPDKSVFFLVFLDFQSYRLLSGGC